RSSTAPAAELLEAGAAEAFQIVLTLGDLRDRHLAGQPAQRDVGLRAAQLAQRRGRDLSLSGHAGSGREHPVGADHTAPLADALARMPHRLLVVAADELGVGGNAVVDRREWIAWTQAQRPAGRFHALLPATAIGERETVVALRQREIRIEAQRQLELG